MEKLQNYWIKNIAEMKNFLKSFSFGLFYFDNTENNSTIKSRGGHNENTFCR